MQIMWTHYLLLQGEVGDRGPPGAPGNVSQTFAVLVSLQIQLLYSQSQAVCKWATVVVKELVVLF